MEQPQPREDVEEAEKAVMSSELNVIGAHSSEKRGLRSTFLSGEMLQNLPYL